MKKAKCKCGHEIKWYPTTHGQVEMGKWKHSSKDSGWYADSCRSCGNDCNCIEPKPNTLL